MPPLWLTLTIGRILTSNTLELSSHRLLIRNIRVKRLLSLLTLDIWILYLLSLNMRILDLLSLDISDCTLAVIAHRDFIPASHGQKDYGPIVAGLVLGLVLARVDPVDMYIRVVTVDLATVSFSLIVVQMAFVATKVALVATEVVLAIARVLEQCLENFRTESSHSHPKKWMRQAKGTARTKGRKAD